MVADQLIVQLLPLALATVISPIVFISLFLVLQGDRAVGNGLLFLVGLITAVGVTAVFSAYVMHSNVSEGGTADTGISWFNLLLGLAELIAGVWLWFKGPRPGHVQPPKILDKLHGAKWFVIVGIGILVPTYPAALSAGAALFRASQSGTGRALAVLAYLSLCALIVGLPVILLAVRRERGVVQIQAASDWLIQRQSTVGAVILMVVGAYLIVAAFWTA